ncbi:hypothetical protein PFICI_10049 [Pestalotiopsis fici W106-1]|uniref:Glutathione S-transferase n=1 Tax=Pestalotiopsis fici (strain W106-1 / CGMCC3.15140) TaxID=1229662 RepID=W3WXW7_PESFW|nr:uncharacterized protein PFICI_10049 [Pestalotiopsis fici W106-1]ETS77987.1 hypothetical protein PFICI_10049 [Pestalotiopsis fici W106-1]
MALQPIELWGHWGAPNPWKVVLILEELKLPYIIKTLEFTEVKSEEYVKLNPNGRLPTIVDPNTGITLWESGAIIGYLIDQYDKAGHISFHTAPEKYLTRQWLAFQISGQGPYYGQAIWFARFHPEKISSAIDRYVNEVVRVIGVLDDALNRGGTGWLVGDKCTYADLAFVTWAHLGYGLLKQLNKLDQIEKYEKYAAWIKSLESRETVKKVLDSIAKGRAEHGLP